MIFEADRLKETLRKKIIIFKYSIRKEILIIFIVFLLVVIGTSLIIHHDNMECIKKMSIEHMKESSIQLSHSADSVVANVGPLFHIHYSDFKIRNILKSDKTVYDEKSRFINAQYIDSAISHIVKNNRFIIRCCIMDYYGSVYSNISSVYQDYRDYIWNIVEKDKEVGNKFVYTGVKEWSINLEKYKVLTAIRILYDWDGVTPIAVLTLDINYDELSAFIETGDKSAFSTLILYEDTILYESANKTICGNNKKILCQVVYHMLDENKDQQVLDLSAKTYFVTAFQNSTSGWIVVQYVSEKFLLQGLIKKWLLDIGVLIIIGIFAFILFYIKISHIMTPLEKMDKVINHNYNGYMERITFTPAEKKKFQFNEVGCVVNNYNNMVDRINEYVEKNLIAEINQKEAQMKMLIYQINPHFLYNTLNTISAMAEIENMDRIVEMTESISNLFRYNLKGDKIVTLEEELRHVKDYIQIQIYRFPDRFSVDYDIPEELLELKMLKFILQPIVENSITHGLSDKKKGGRIIIRAQMEELNKKNFILSVDDNGNGINRKRLELINKKLSDSRVHMCVEEPDHDGIGINNVNIRLSNYYGIDYGVTLYSEYGQWTKAVMRLKVIKD